MGATELHDEQATAEETRTESLSLAPDVVEVRRRAGLAAALGLPAAGLSIAYLARAAQTGTAGDWLLAVAMGALGVGWLAAFVDARTPLLVADTQGVRLRLGRSWRGLGWSAVQHVEHTPRRGLWRDGRLVVVPHNPERLLAELDRGARRRALLAQRRHGAPFAIALGLSTRVVGAGDDVSAALTRVDRRASPARPAALPGHLDLPARRRGSPPSRPERGRGGRSRAPPCLGRPCLGDPGSAARGHLGPPGRGPP